jgi:hypothetical protein
MPEEVKVYPPCLHEKHTAWVDVTRLSDPSQPLDFHADVRIQCAQCKCKFRFLGLPMGFRMKCAAVSFDGTEARLAIEPVEPRGNENDSVSPEHPQA